MESSNNEPRRSNFITAIIDEDLAAGRHKSVVTRFPPEPNGYPHIGHAKSICLNFGLARDYGGRCHLRMDDTNPTTEDMEFVQALQDDVRWLGFEWGEHMYYASDYFERLYQLAVGLIKDGKAYVCSLSEDEIRAGRGSLSAPGTPSPYRERSVEENLDLFKRMRGGEFKDGEHVLRARIDMAAANMKMRDPLLYRIRHAHHYRTEDDWCIYPLYDFAHCLSDSIEGITHSICTLEFENNRELYDWLIEHSQVEAAPHQYEFARLNLANTVMSKRKLRQLVEEGHVDGWDDPRMPTISGMRRRGYTPEAIRNFCDMIGVAKANSQVDFEKLEYSVRSDLNHKAPRVMAVLKPLKVTLTTWPEDHVETLDASLWPHDVPREGTRPVPMTRELYIERTDFEEVPPRKFRRLSPGAEVRLRYSYIIKCDEVIKDEQGDVIELRCSHDPNSRSGQGVGRKVKGTIHWVSASHAVPATVHIYDRLFSQERPGSGGRDFKEDLNPDSRQTLTAFLEPSVASDAPGSRYQFERQGYFISDAVVSKEGALVFNRIVGLRDSWSKQQRATKASPKANPAATSAAKAPDTSQGDAPSERKRPQKRSKAYERQKAREANPTLAARYTRYQDALGLTEGDADLLSGGIALGDFFEAALAAHDDVALTTNWVVNELMFVLKGEDDPSALPFDGARFGALVALVASKAINNNTAKDVLAKMVETGDAPGVIVDREGLRQMDDEADLRAAVDKVFADNPDEAQRLRGGEKKLMGFFIGRVMKATGGKANPKLTRKLIMERS